METRILKPDPWPLTFESQVAWESYCRHRGFDGPHAVINTQCLQFVGKKGTEAIWNYEHQRGYVFHPPDSASLESGDG